MKSISTKLNDFVLICINTVKNSNISNKNHVLYNITMSGSKSESDAE